MMDSKTANGRMRTAAAITALSIALAIFGASHTLASSRLNAARCLDSPDGCSWSDDFNRTGSDGEVLTSVVWDDGSGPAVYVGGSFQDLGSQSVEYLAKWNGQDWAPVMSPSGAGVDDIVRSLLVFDDGSGEALFVGGDFEQVDNRTANGIARWSGAEWSQLDGPDGIGLTHRIGIGGEVFSMVVHDEGYGEALYVGGRFYLAGGMRAENIARWDGDKWSALVWIAGIGIGPVSALETYDGTLVAAGRFGTQHVMVWNGAYWDSIGSVEFTSAYTYSSFPVLSLKVLDSDHGSVLVAGGRFAEISGVTASGIALWDGDSWSPIVDADGYQLADLFPSSSNPFLWGPLVATIETGPDDERASFVVAGTNYWQAGWGLNGWYDVTTSAFVALLDQGRWSVIADGTSGVISDGQVSTLSWVEDRHGPSLVAGGRHLGHQDRSLGAVASWDGQRWERLTPFPGNGVVIKSPLGNGHVPPHISALESFPVQGATSLYAAGSFTIAGDQPTRHIARWDGEGWTALTDESGNGSCAALDCTPITALEVFDSGSGPALYAAATRRCSNSFSTAEIARWDGSQWRKVPTADECDSWDRINDMIVFNDGTTSSLVVAGWLTPWGPLGRFDGNSWSGIEGIYANPINQVEVWDDGTGPDLYVAGDYIEVTGRAANGIARWDGDGWAVLEGPMEVGLSSGSGRPEVNDMVVHDDGGGEALYVAGHFRDAGGLWARNIARWNGREWQPLPGQFGPGTDEPVQALAVYDDGEGDALHVAGGFTWSGGIATNGLARWKDDEWSAVCPNQQKATSIRRLAVHNDGGGEGLFAAGGFTKVCGAPSQGVAKLNCLRFDYGDAPQPPYPTLIDSNGPRHAITQGVHLGETVNHEPDGKPSEHADADDFDDGVTFVSPLIPGLTTRIDVSASVDAILDG